jgi:hypothetical protein
MLGEHVDPERDSSRLNSARVYVMLAVSPRTTADHHLRINLIENRFLIIVSSPSFVRCSSRCITAITLIKAYGIPRYIVT